MSPGERRRRSKRRKAKGLTRLERRRDRELHEHHAMMMATPNCRCVASFDIDGERREMILSPTDLGGGNYSAQLPREATERSGSLTFTARDVLTDQPPGVLRSFTSCAQSDVYVVFDHIASIFDGIDRSTRLERLAGPSFTMPMMGSDTFMAGILAHLDQEERTRNRRRLDEIDGYDRVDAIAYAYSQITATRDRK